MSSYCIKMGVKYWGGEEYPHWVTQSWDMWPGSSIRLGLYNISCARDDNSPDFKYIDMPWRVNGNLINANNDHSNTQNCTIFIDCKTDDGVWPYLRFHTADQEAIREQSVILDRVGSRMEYRTILNECLIDDSPWQNWDLLRRQWNNNIGCIRRPSMFKQRQTDISHGSHGYGWRTSADMTEGNYVHTYLDQPINENGILDLVSGSTTFHTMLNYIKSGNRSSNSNANNINIFNSNYHSLPSSPVIWKGDVYSSTYLNYWPFTEVMSIRYCPRVTFYEEAPYHPFTSGRETNFPGWVYGIGGNVNNLFSNISNWSWADYNNGYTYHPYRKQYMNQGVGKWGVSVSVFDAYLSLTDMDGSQLTGQQLPLMGATSPQVVGSISDALSTVLYWTSNIASDTKIKTTWARWESTNPSNVRDALMNTDNYGSIGIRAVTCDPSGNPVEYSDNSKGHLINCLIVPPSLLSDWMACDIYGLSPKEGVDLPSEYPTVFNWMNRLSWLSPLLEGSRVLEDRSDEGVYIYSTVAH